jgi:hypothetical protein
MVKALDDIPARSSVPTFSGKFSIASPPRNAYLIFVAVKSPAGLSLPMVKKGKKPISIGPQFYTLLALTDTIVAELRWGKKKNSRLAKIAPPLTTGSRLIRKRLSGKLKIERL